MSIKDLTGQSFGNLFVIEDSGNRNKSGHVLWICECTCGKVFYVQGTDLVLGKSGSCGARECKVTKHRQHDHNYSIIKSRAKKRKIPFNVTKDEYINITIKPCMYCGESSYNYRSLDRLDSAKGYTVDNVVPCCDNCNNAKNTLTIDEFKDHIIKIYDYWILNGTNN